MTNEEAIENLKLVRLNAAMTGAASFKEALDLAIVALSQPSLPSNMDEAAEEEYPDFSNSIASKAAVDSMRDAFKAGAEWIAGQFQEIEGELVDWFGTSDGKEYCCGVKTDDAFEVPEGFYIKKK